MPLPNNALLHLDIHLRADPLAKLPEHEKQRMIALTTINHVASLGRAVSFLSTEKIRAASFEARKFRGSISSRLIDKVILAIRPRRATIPGAR